DIHYDPDFATRGLHYDVTTGWLMKMDAYNHIQLDTVHLGKERVPPEIVTERHQGLNVSPQYVENNTQQLIDLFSLPWACLLADVIQLFKDRNISFHPHHLYDDLHACTEYIHKGEGLTMSLLHSKILEDLPRYLDRSPKLTAYLEKLQRHGKKTFLLTNSGFKFVDKGLAYVTGRDDWRDLFDLTIVRSAKPTFYRSNQPFRMIIPPKSSSPDAASVAQATWGRVSGFQPGAVYQGGNLRDFSQWTGWNGSRSSVIYFGDSLYSDLGAIIGELGRELEIRQKFTYHRDLTFLESLERLMKRAQRIGLEDRPTRQAYRAALQSWREERKEMHHRLKHSFNPQFGSVFRTHHSASGFAAKIRSHADIYTSRLENVGQYPLDHVFYPDRTYLQHEQTIDFTSPFRL
ncbi:MAG: HAD-superfamily hydrolase, partial [Piptocephalis tieghemiana]